MDSSGVTVNTNPTVDVRVSSTLEQYVVNRRFNRGITIAEFKCKLEMVIGTPASCMDLELFSPTDQLLQKLDNDEALLGSYPVDDDCRIHVIDRSGAKTGEFSDLSKVEKFELTEDAYDKRSDTVREFRKKQRIGRFNEEETAKKEAIAAMKEEKEKEAAAAIAVGNRCKVWVTGQPDKLGTVMYVGLTDFKPGYWVGVKYDEPMGKHDGSVQGKQYFECENKYGAFVKPGQVTVGDFPEEDYGLDEM